MGDIIRPNDLRMPPEGQPQKGGMNPGGIEALRKGISYMLQYMSPEQLLEALLGMARNMPDLNVDEKQLRAMIEEAQGAAPPQQPTGTPGMEGEMPATM